MGVEWGREQQNLFFLNCHSVILWTWKFSINTERNIKNVCYFEFSHFGFLVSQDERTGLSKKKSVILTPIFIYLHILFQTKPKDFFLLFSTDHWPCLQHIPLSDGWFCLPFSKEGRFLKIQIRKSIKYSKKEKHTP